MSEEFQRLQRTFAKQLRSTNSANDTRFGEARRVAIYRRLVHNNIANFIDAVCPVLKACVTSEEWCALRSRFIATATSDSPYFADIGHSFVRFLQTNPNDPIFSHYPYAAELAHYEWIELLVSRRDNDIGTNLNGLWLNSTAEINAYHYPVDKISADFQPLKPLQELRWLLAYRSDATANQVKFVKLQGLTALLLKRLEEYPNQPFTELLSFFVEHLPTMTKEQLKQGLLQTLNDFSERRIVHGFDLSSASKIQ